MTPETNQLPPVTIAEVVDSLQFCMANSPTKWLDDVHLAWVHGIIYGWNDGEMAWLSEKHGWDGADVLLLKSMHETWIETHGTLGQKIKISEIGDVLGEAA